MKSWRLRASMSLRRGMSAVCGMGTPSGCRKIAVTANQSAIAPTIEASAPAWTNPQNPWSATRRVARKTTAAKTSRPRATARIWRRPRRRSASSAGSEASASVSGWDNRGLLRAGTAGRDRSSTLAREENVAVGGHGSAQRSPHVLSCRGEESDLSRNFSTRAEKFAQARTRGAGTRDARTGWCAPRIHNPNTTLTASSRAGRRVASVTSDPRAALVMVVEDDAAIAQMISLQLELSGYRTHVERDGLAALEAIRRERPAVVLLDIGLPGLDGIQVCRRLRSADDWTPILFVTARDDEVDRVVGLELGADDYITKPFSPREVIARIGSVLRRGGLRDQGPTVHELVCGDVTLRPDERRAFAGRRRVHAHRNGVRPPGPPHGLTRPGLHPRAAAAAGVGLRQRRRPADGRRARRAGARQARRPRRHPDRAWGGVRRAADDPRRRPGPAVRTRLRPTLATRIALLAVSVALLTSIAGGVISVNLLQRASEQTARSALSALADQAQATAEGGVSAEVAQARARKALQCINVQIAVAAHAARRLPCSGRRHPRQPVARRRSRSSAWSTARPSRCGSPAPTASSSSRPGPPRPAGWFSPSGAATPWPSGGQALRDLTILLVITGVVAVLLGLLVAWRLARPLKRTAAAATALAQGSRDVAIPETGPREVAEVAASVNRLAGALSHSEARQREFLLSVSHDLRTPLTAITGYAESLADGVVPPERLAVGRSGHRRRGRAGSSGSSPTCSTSRGSTRQEMRMRPAPVDLRAVVDGAAETLAAPLRPGGRAVPHRGGRRPRSSRSSTPNACARRSTGSWRTRCASRRRVRPSSSPPGGSRATSPSSRCATADPGSPTTTCPWPSSGRPSTSATAASGRWAPGWGWPSCTASSSGSAAPSRRATPRGWRPLHHPAAPPVASLGPENRTTS